jgi:ABC-type nitrate/sulfonate/bicarbonate transport system substrate-binding protein
MVRLNISGNHRSGIRPLSPMVSKLILVAVIAVSLQGLPNGASGLDTANLALTNRNFQMALYPIAQERGYMQEEGIDLRPVLVRSELSIQAMIAGSFQFSMAGTMGLVSVAKGGAPLKIILATNDKVLSWILSKPELKSLKDLKGKRVAVSGVTSATTIIAKQVLAKHGLDVTGTFLSSIREVQETRFEPLWQAPLMPSLRRRVNAMPADPAVFENWFSSVTK